MRRSLAFATVLSLTIAGPVDAETAPLPSTTTQPAPVAGERFRLESYLSEVGRGNLDLIAQRSTVSIAEAQIAIARVFPDPQVTAGLFQYDVTQKGNPTATIVQVNVPLEVGGQRGARVSFAGASLSAAQADLLEFVRGLEADAANAYVEALHARYVVDRRRQTLASLERLVAVNQERFKAGDIGEASVIQSRVEANQFRAAVLDAEGSVSSADIAVVSFLGASAPSRMQHRLELEGDLRATSNRHFNANDLVRIALKQRPDIIASRRRLTAANRAIDLAQANRVIPVAVGASWQHNFQTNATPSLPASDFLGATVTVPLPFSRLYRGDLDAAYAGKRQAEALSRGTSVRVEGEVREAFARYEAAAARVRLYATGVLADADAVLEKTLYNYQRGGATLVEVLVAQRTDNDVYLSYYDSLADAAHALIGVERAAGIWDVVF